MNTQIDSQMIFFKLVINSLISELFIILILSADFLLLNFTITNPALSFILKNLLKSGQMFMVYECTT